MIRDVKDLEGLAGTPRMLSFIAELPEDQLQQARQQHGEITAAELYRQLLQHWLDLEEQRVKQRGGPPTLTAAERQHAVTELALAMWPRPERTIRIDEIERIVPQAVDRWAERHLEEKTLAHIVGSSTLLIRDEEGLFSFIHQSLMEWLIANRAAEELKSGQPSAVLGSCECSSLMAKFLIELAGREHVMTWLAPPPRTTRPLPLPRRTCGP